MNHGILDSPCIFCGYCAAGYYQPNTHNSGCPWREVGGLAVREMALRGVIKSALARLTAAEARAERLREAANQAVIKLGAICDIANNEADSEVIVRIARAASEELAAALSDTEGKNAQS